MKKPAWRPAVEQVQAYMRVLADRLALRDWEISYEHGDEAEVEDDLWGVNKSFPGQRAQILLGAKFYAGTPEVQRGVLVHELLHCHTVQLALLGEDMEPESPEGQLVVDMLENATEHAV